MPTVKSTPRRKVRKPYAGTAAQVIAALDNLSKAHEAQRTLPRCGAQRRSAEGTCQNLALENGRCRLHGGRTPKGKDWHKVQLANPGGSVERLAKKQQEVKARRAKQAARRAAMTPEQLSAYEEWLQTHQPTGTSGRERARHARAARDWLQSLQQGAQRPAAAAERAEALQRTIEALEAEAARLARAADRSNDEGDIFG